MNVYVLYLVLFLWTFVPGGVPGQSSEGKIDCPTGQSADLAGLVQELMVCDSVKNSIVLSLTRQSISSPVESFDFSDLTKGLEQEYLNCPDSLLREVLGFELVQNYFLRYRSSSDQEDKQKADTLFYRLLGFRQGLPASVYLKLDIDKTRFLQQHWTHFSESEKDTVLFYSLLRGFDAGLPQLLENAR